MNWGHKITIVILLFLVGILGMVLIAYRQTNEMFDDHYYEKELVYQEVIDARQNLTDRSSESVIIQNPDELTFTFPKGTYEKIERGTIEFLRNDARDKDVVLAITPDSSGIYKVPKSKLHKGMYKVRVKWTNNNTPYYLEESIFVE